MFGDILLLIEVTFGQVFDGCISIRLCPRERYLYVDHLTMILQHSLFLCFPLCHLYVDEEVVALDEVLAWLKGTEVIVFNKIDCFCKQRIQIRVLSEIFQCVDNHIVRF